MPDFYTAAEIANLTNAVLDFYMKGPPKAQTLQNRPTLERLRAEQSTFPGGREFVRGNVKGEYTTAFNGYQYDDTVEYRNPANIKQFMYRWYELHAGISMTNTELKAAGITVVDTMTGERTSTKSGASVMVISNLLEDKLDDMMEGSMRSMNTITWRDGTQDSKVFPGIPAFVRDDPTTGIVGGIDAAVNTWWRNRALVGSNKIVSSPTNQTAVKKLGEEMRQLRRYGGNPNYAVAGSGAITKLEAEVREKGTYTMTGWQGNQNIGIGDIVIPGVGPIKYDPTLDDEGRTNFLYILDTRHLKLKPMDGEDMKTHAPARPAEKYVLYRAVTWSGLLMADQLNCHGVYELA